MASHRKRKENAGEKKVPIMSLSIGSGATLR